MVRAALFPMKPRWNCFIPLCALAACLPAVCLAEEPPVYTISTIAGTGIAGSGGDGGPGTSAQLNNPAGLFLRSNGDLYIADSQNFKIRLLSSGGTMTTVAGSGSPGFQGDGVSATSAELNSPYAVVVDSSGNLFIADSRNHLIRKVTSGTITTLAGTGDRGFAGDGSPATGAMLSLPTGLAIGPDGSLYIADTANSRIRRIGSDGNITTIAGNGIENYNGDGIPATDATLNRPGQIVFDSAGNLYVADTFNHRIRKIDPDGIISTVAGGGAFLGGFAGDGGPASSAVLNYPRGVAVDGSGRVFIADSLNNRIRMVTEDGNIHTIAGDGRYFDSGDDGPALKAQMRFPRQLAVTPEGKVIVADTDSSRIRLLTPQPQLPVISQDGAVTPAAFGGFAGAAPGSWLEIYGRDLAARTREWSAGDFVDDRAPTSLGGTSVTVGGREAFVSYASPGQVNVQVPSDVIPGTLDLVVHTGEGDSAAYSLEVADTEPGLLAPPQFSIGGKQYAVGVLADGTTFALPEGAIAGVASRAPRPGEVVTFYGVGFGPVAPLLAAGQVVRRETSLVLPLEVFFGDAPAEVTYAGLVPGSLGLYQINAIVPGVAAADAVPLRFTLDGQAGAQQLFTAVGR